MPNDEIQTTSKPQNEHPPVDSVFTDFHDDVDKDDAQDEPTGDETSSTPEETAQTAQQPPDESGAQQDPATTEPEKVDLSQVHEANKGLLKSVKAERVKRQETQASLQQVQGRLDQITSVLNEMFAARDSQQQPPQPKDPQAAQQPQSPAQAPTGDTGASDLPDQIPIDFNEDGDAFIPADYLKKLGNSLSTQQPPQAIQEIKQRLDNHELYLQNQNAASKLANTRRAQEAEIVTDDPARQKAYQSVTEVFDDLGAMAKEFCDNTGIEYPEHPDAAFDIIRNQKVRDQFTKKYPGVEPQIVLASVIGEQQTGQISGWTYRLLLDQLATLHSQNGGQDTGDSTGLTQQELLDRAGSHPPNMNNVGGGKTRQPSGKPVPKMTFKDIVDVVHSADNLQDLRQAVNQATR